MMSGKDYLDGIDAALAADIDTETQRLEYFIKANARMRNSRFPFVFSVKNCSLPVIDTLAGYLERNGWAVTKNKDYILLTPAKPNP